MSEPAPADDGRARLLIVDGELDVAMLEAEYAADRWQAERLGVDAVRGRDVVRFDGITQPWLRHATKQWCRWRLATGLAFASISAFALALSRFSQFVAACEPDAACRGCARRASHRTAGRCR